MNLLVVVAVLVINIAASYPSEASQLECWQYQGILRKANGIRERCGLPAFSDCCLPKSLVPLAPTGIYDISNVCDHESPFQRIPSGKMNVRCDMDTNGGGWLVIQRRIKGGMINFTRNWEAYEQGFGDLEGEFWFGLRNIHCLTTREEVELRIDMQNADGLYVNWTYQEFRVDGPEDNYRLRIGQGEGTLGNRDAMVVHNNHSFSTYDRDNDPWSTQNCAVHEKGGGWYNRCSHASLNSPHGDSKFRWYTGYGNFYPANVEMKVRPKTCTPTTERCP